MHSWKNEGKCTLIHWAAGLQVDIRRELDLVYFSKQTCLGIYSKICNMVYNISRTVDSTNLKQKDSGRSSSNRNMLTLQWVSMLIRSCLSSPALLSLHPFFYSRDDIKAIFKILTAQRWSCLSRSRLHRKWDFNWFSSWHNEMAPISSAISGVSKILLQLVSLLHCGWWLHVTKEADSI